MEGETGKYFVRARGKISGPFDAAGLQKLVRRGAVSRMHEISSDRQSWLPAGEIEDLFPVGPGARSGGGQPVDNEASVVPPPRGPSASPAASVNYFYAQNGIAIGPVPPTVLFALAQSRTLRPTDLVWQEGKDTGTPAGQLSILAAFYSDRSRGDMDPRGVRPGEEEVPAAVRRGASNLVMGWGLGVGIMILLFLNLPLAVVDHKVGWWWTALSSPGSGLFLTYCAVLLIAGITLCIASPLCPPVARGPIFITVSGIIALLLLVTALCSSSPGEGMVGVVAFYLLPVFCAIVSSTCRARALHRSSQPARVLMIIFAGLAGIWGLVLAIVAIIEGRGVSSLPEPFIAAYVLSVLAFTVAFAAGVLGVITGARPASKPLGIATTLCATACPVFLAVAMMLMYAAFVDMAQSGYEPSGFWNNAALTDTSQIRVSIFLLLVRIVAIGMGLAGLSGIGVFDLLLGAKQRSGDVRRPIVARAAHQQMPADAVGRR